MMHRGFLLCLITTSCSQAIAQPLEEIRVDSLGSRGVVFSGESPHTLDEYVSPAGDVNGDGFGDILLVSTNIAAEYERTVYIVYGRADLPSELAFEELPELGTTFARSSPRFRGTDLIRNVGAAGDIDGDGFDDFLIMRTYGAPDGWTGPNEVPGLVYLVYGSDALPREVPLDNPTEGVRITRLTSTKNSRTSLAVDAANGGDLNGDGKNDLVLGAGFSESDDAEYERGPGRVYVIFGGTELVGLLDVEEVGKTLPGIIIEGSVDGEYLGLALEFAGDVDGDGVDDLLAGAPSPLGSQAGAAYLIYGGTDLPAFTRMEDLVARNGVTRLDGRGSTTSVFGTAKEAGKVLAAAGDLNGDGFADFLIGSSGAKRQAGHAYLVYGRADLPADVELPAIENTGLGVVISGHEADQLLGAALTSLDFSGDGRREIVIGAFGADYLGMHWAGIAYILPGADLVAPGPVLSFADPIEPVSTILRKEIPLEGVYRHGPSFGYSAANAGDVNGDGRDDLLVSAPTKHRDSTGGPTGWVYLLYGRDGSLERLGVESVRPDVVSMRGGDRVSIVGTGFDQDTVVRIGDAVATVTRVETSARLAAEVPAAASPGLADVVLVRDQETARLPGALRYVPKTYPELDVTELATSARGFVVSGTARSFGSSLCLVDHDGDGLHDIVTPAGDGLLVVYGRREAAGEISIDALLDPDAGELPPGIATIQVRPDARNRSVTAVGDVNADGLDDVAYGDRSSATITLLLGGRRFGREVLEDLVVTGRTVEVLLGNLSPGERFAVTGGEDLDGDGIDDLAVGIADFLDTGPGRVTVLHGRSVWPPTVFLEDGPTLWHFGPEERFGASVAAPGDVDVDGKPDLLVTTPGRYFGDAGNVYIISGEVLGAPDLELEQLLAAGFAFQLDSFKHEDVFGHQATRLGDFNGDGHRDIALSAEAGGVSFQGEAYAVFGGPWLEGAPGAAPLAMRDLGDRGVRCLGELSEDRAAEIAPAGDFNADGFDDLLIGASAGARPTGTAYVVFGGPARTIRLDSLGADGLRMTGDVLLGNQLAGGGDFNGDGVDDVVVRGGRLGITRARLYVVFGESSHSRFVRGDANANSTVDLSDPVFFLGSLFAGAGELLCQDAADGNDDGSLDVADAIFVLGHLFSGGAPIPPPFPEAGVDPTDDGLGCEGGQ